MPTISIAMPAKKERERDSGEAKQPKACVSPLGEEGMVMHFMGSPIEREMGVEILRYNQGNP